MRRRLLTKPLQDAFCGIFDSFVVENLLRGVDEGNLQVARLVTAEQFVPIQTVRLAHTTTHLVALVGAFEKAFRCREEHFGIHLVGRFGIDNISQRVDEAPLALAEKAADSPKRAEPLGLM